MEHTVLLSGEKGVSQIDIITDGSLISGRDSTNESFVRFCGRYWKMIIVSSEEEEVGSADEVRQRRRENITQPNRLALIGNYESASM